MSSASPAKCAVYIAQVFNATRDGNPYIRAQIYTHALNPPYVTSLLAAI